MSYIPMSEAREGETVTTQTEHNGVGLGHLVGGTVYVSTGNGFAVSGDKNFPKVTGFTRDGGAGYRARVQKVMGW